MTDTLASRQFVQTFLTPRPRDGLTIVKDRQKQGKALDESLLQYFRARATLEHQYAKGLTKVAKQLFVTDRTTLGNFAPIWDLLANELTEISTVHEAIARTTTEEIETPLKTAASPAQDQIKSMEPAMDALAKEFDQETKRSTAGKGSFLKRMGSVAHRSNSKNTPTTWQNEGPAYLESHQTLEEARLERIKTLVEKFEQLQTDHMLKRMEIAQITMVAAHEFSVQKEIDDFCRGAEGRGIRAQPSSFSRQSGRFSMQRESSPNIPTIVAEESQSTDDSNHFDRPLSVLQPLSTGGNSTQSNEFPQQSPALLDARQTPLQSKRLSSRGLEESDGFESSGVWSTSSDAQGFSQLTEANRQIATDQGDVSALDVDHAAFPKFDSNFSQDPDEFSLETSSISMGPRLKFDIKQQPVDLDRKNDGSDAAETYAKMANMLREKSPTVVHRVRRGRRQQGRSSYPGPFGAQNTNSVPPPPLSFIANDAVHVDSPLSRSTVPDVNRFRQDPTDVSTPTSLTTTISSTSDTLQHLGSIPEQRRPELCVSVLEAIDTDPSSAEDDNNPYNISGTIQFSYKGPSAPTSPLLVRVQHPSPSVLLSPNTTYMEPFAEEEHIYTVHPQAFERDHDTLVTCLTYTAKTDKSILPIQLSRAHWKCGDMASYLMVQYSMEDEFDASTCHMTLSVLFDDVPVSSVKTKPAGQWHADTAVMIWTTDALLDHHRAAKQEGQPAKILAKFETSRKGTPKAIRLKYASKDAAATQIRVESVSSLGSSLQVQPMQARIQSNHMHIA